MADRILALSLLITAKDQATAVIQKVRAALGKTSEESGKYARDTQQATGATDRFAGSVGGLVGRLTALAGAYFSVTKIKSALDSVLETGGLFERLGNQMSAAFRSVAEGDQATAWITRFAKDTPFQLEGVTKAFQTLKNFGLDPMDGTMQAIADKSSELGAEQQTLEGISLALGQAWAKQKLQGEEILQLIERGVPVWELLQRVTGRNVEELNKMASAGELGRDVIKALIDEMGRSSEGAAASMMSSWEGLTSNLSDTWTQFLNTVAQSGTLDFFKAQLDGLLRTVEQMSAGGELRKIAQDISDFFVGTGQAAKTTILTIKDFASELKAVGIVLANVFGANYLRGLAQSAKGMVDNAMAAREKAAADKTAAAAAIELLQVEIKKAQVSVITQKGLIEEARLQIALANTEKERAKALKQQDLAMQGYHEAVNRGNALQREMKTVLDGTATSATLASKAFTAMNNAISLVFAWNIGKAVGEWLRQFESVRTAGSYLAETFEIIRTGAEGLFSGISLSERWDQLKRIHADFEDLRNQSIIGDQHKKDKSAIDDLTGSLDDLKKSSDIEISPKVDLGAANELLKNIDNIAEELRKLSDRELSELKNALEDAFNAGIDRTEELSEALDSINTEEVSRAWKTLGQTSQQSLDDAAQAAKKAYVTIRDSGTASSNDLAKAWDAYIKKINEAKHAIDQTSDAEQRRKEGLAELDAIGAGPESTEQKKQRLAEETYEYKRLLDQQEFERAASLAQQSEQLALDIAKAEEEAYQRGEATSWDAERARESYNDSVDRTIKALDELSKREQEALPEPGEDQNNAIDQRLEAGKQLVNLLKEAGQPVNVQINDNFDATISKSEILLANLQAIAQALPAAQAQANAAIDNGDAIAREALMRGRR